MNKASRLIGLLGGVALVAAACGNDLTTTAPPSAPSTAPSTATTATASGLAASVDPTSLLGIVLASSKGISTDPNHKPFSFTKQDGTFQGFDISTADEAVKRLSDKLGKPITIDWQTPNLDKISAGSWTGRWDISVGSMSVTVGRAKVLDFVDPYYYESGAVAAPKSSTVRSLSGLDSGRAFCVGAGTTSEQWLNKTLAIVDPNIVTPPTNPLVTSLPTDDACVQAMAAGRKFDAVVANAKGLADAVKGGEPIRVLAGPPIFTVSFAFALDKSGPDDKSLIALFNTIVGEMHADGTLSRLSTQWLQEDVTQKPS
jgi:polar amino acid transport system substrate-binding protein